MSPSESFNLSKIIGLNYQEEIKDLSTLQGDPKQLLEYFKLSMTERPDWIPKSQTSLKYIDLISTYEPTMVPY